MRTSERSSGIPDHFIAAALYDGLKELVTYRWSRWVELIVPSVIALSVLLARIGLRRSKTPIPDLADDRSELVLIYFGPGEVGTFMRASCLFHATEFPVTLRIMGPGTKYFIALPLVVGVAGRKGIVLLSSTGLAAYAVSSKCPRPEPLNGLPSGAYEVDLNVSDEVHERWTLRVGGGCPPSLQTKC